EHGVLYLVLRQVGRAAHPTAVVDAARAACCSAERAKAYHRVTLMSVVILLFGARLSRSGRHSKQRSREDPCEWPETHWFLPVALLKPKAPNGPSASCEAD